MLGQLALSDHPKARWTDPELFPEFASQSIFVGLLSLNVAPDHVPQAGADLLPRAAASEQDAPVPHQHSPDETHALKHAPARCPSVWDGDGSCFLVDICEAPRGGMRQPGHHRE